MKVYCIENILDGKKYIGITKGTIERRFKQHKQLAKNVSKENQHLHDALIKYGFKNFIIYQQDEAGSIDELYEKEKYWIKTLDTKKNGYNETDGGEGSHGRVLSEETKQKIRKKALQRFEDVEQRKHLSQKSKEWVTQLSKEDKEIISKKLSLAGIGNQRAKDKRWTLSDENKKNIGNAKKGRIVSEETKKKLSERAKLRTGRKCSQETIKKMRQSALNRKTRIQ
jgi:group I intron endonuclease